MSAKQTKAPAIQESEQENNLEQVTYALIEVSDSAEIIKQLMLDALQAMSGPNPQDRDTLAANIKAAEKLASMVGYIADLCLSKMGELELKGGAEEWMLSPEYNSYAKKNKEGVAA